MHSKKFWILAIERDKPCRKAYIDSTPLPVCEDVRSPSHRVFASMARWAHSSTGAKFGLKMHMIVGGDQKIRNFVLKPGNLHDVSCAEEVLKNFRGTVIGDSAICAGVLAVNLGC